MRDFGWLERREAMRLLGVGGMALVASLPGRVHAAATKNTLVLGLDISDTISLDPAREAQVHPAAHPGGRVRGAGHDDAW